MFPHPLALSGQRSDLHVCVRRMGVAVEHLFDESQCLDASRRLRWRAYGEVGVARCRMASMRRVDTHPPTCYTQQHE